MSPDRHNKDIYTANLDTTLLDPFFVDVDRQKIFQDFPEVETMLPYNPNVVLVMYTPSGKSLGSIGTGRAQRRIMDHNAHQTQLYDVLNAATHLLDERADSQQKGQIADFYIGSWLDTQTRYVIEPSVDDYLRQAVERIDDLHVFFNGINTLAHPMQNRTMERIHDDPVAQYQLLKTLATVESDRIKIPSPEDHEALQDLKTLHWLNLLTLVKGPQKRNMVSELLKSQLSRGTFDSLIAQDMLHAIDGRPEETIPDSLKPVANYKRQLEYVAGIKLDESGIARLAQSIAIMPKEVQRAIYHHRDEFEKVLDYIQSAVDMIMHRVAVIPGHDYEKELNSAMELLFADLSAESIVVRAITNRAVIPDTNGVPPKVKKRTLARSEPIASQALPATEIEAATRKPLELKYMDSSGNLHPQVEGQLGEVVEKYLKPYNGDRNLRSDIENILRHIAHPTELDLSNRVAGIMKLNGGFTAYVTMPDGSKARPDLHEFKPTKAVNLPLTTDIAKRTRVYVVYPDSETVVVAGISHKQSSNKEIERISGKKTTTKEKA